MDRARIGRLGHAGGWLGSLATLTLAAACSGPDGDPNIGIGGQGGSGDPGTSGGTAGAGGTAQPGNGGAAAVSGGATSGGASSGGASSGGSSSGGTTATSGGASSGTGGAVAGSAGAGTGGRGNTGGRSGTGGTASGGAAGSKATGGAAGSAGTPGSVADEYVAAHNAVRAAVTEPSNYTGTWAPLPPVTWNETVAATAQAWAEHLRDTENCGLVHDTNSGYGENLAAGSGKMTPTTAVNLWAGEKANYTYAPKYAFMSNTGHYTQIVWRTSVEIGCGSATCGNSTVICCRYSPPGNYIGKAPY